MTRQDIVNQITKKQSFLCVGLDTDIKKIPAHLLSSEDPIFAFNKAIIDATAQYCIAYKPNLAFYESMGVKGWISFEKTIKYLKQNYPEQFIIDGFIAEVNKKIDKLIFQGDKTLTTNPNLKWIDGFIKVFQADGTQVTASAGATTILAKLQELYAGMDGYTLARGAEIYVSPANYRAFLMSLVNANLFHYPSAENGTFPKEFFLPGTDAKVMMTEGMEGVNNVALATFPDNMKYGCDMENDQEDVAVKYDPIKELFYVKALWNSGVQVAFPGKAFWMSI